MEWAWNETDTKEMSNVDSMQSRQKCILKEKFVHEYSEEG